MRAGFGVGAVSAKMKAPYKSLGQFSSKIKHACCMCVCICACICVYICVCIYLCMYENIHTCMAGKSRDAAAVYLSSGAVASMGKVLQEAGGESILKIKASVAI